MKIVNNRGEIVNNPTSEQIGWAKWASHKSNKDRWIEQEEKEAEELEEWLRNYYLGL